MNVLVVGMKRSWIEEYIASVERGIIGCNYDTLTVLVVEDFNGAIDALNTGIPDVLHLVNEVGLERLRYAHGCERLAQVIDQVARKPLVNIEEISMVNYLQPIFDRHRLPPRYGNLPDAIRIRLVENRLYSRRAS